ncbi:MAG TPA: tripartite tricarboxylate transporter permease, partial [Candidatus Thermoplasmatota archaeon]
ILSVAAALPFQWLLSGPFAVWEFVRTHLFWLVIVLAVMLVILEPGMLGPEAWHDTFRAGCAKAASVLILVLSSAYGLLLSQLPYKAYLPVPPSPLLPALSGLFGGATVLASLVVTAKLPHQFLRVRHRDVKIPGAAAALGSGVVAGATMSVLPGLTNASATALATMLRKGTNEETIVSVSAVNTANAMFNLVVLYLYGRTRSGAVVAMKDLWSVDTWYDRVPIDLANFGIVALLTGFGSMLITLAIGKHTVRQIQRVPYRGLSWGVLAYMVATVAVFTGAAGLLVFAVGIAIGTLPVKLGLQRVALTGVLLGPVLVYLAPAALTF